MTARKFKVAILMCDTPLDSVVTQFGNYLSIFQSLLQTSLNSLKLDEEIVLEAYGFDMIQMEYPNWEDKFDGYLITGSSHSSYNNDTWILKLLDFVKLLDERIDDLKLVGICFGHQIIARAFDEGSVIKNPLGWEIGPLPFDLSNIGKQVFGEDKSSLVIEQMHQDHVIRVPATFFSLGSTPKSPVQGLYKPNRMFSVQGHPEFNETIVKLIVEKRYGSKVFTKEVADEVKTRLQNPHDGLKIAETIWKFFLELI